MLEKLLNVLKNTRSWKLVLHNNPDPDAIGSAYAFSYLLSKLGKRSKIFYKGIIGRAENKEMVRRLKINLLPIENLTIKKDMNIALFDSQPGAKNQPLPLKFSPKIVIDHHPFKKETKKCIFYDVRENYGSSSTIVAEYLQTLKIELNEKVATALYYGLKTDTFNFTRDFTKIDLSMLQFFIEKVSMNIIGKIENPPLSKEYYRKIAISLQNLKIYDKGGITNIEKVLYPDICAEVADFIIRMKNLKWVLTFSYFNNNLYFSIRTKSRQKIAGKLALYIIKGVGSGGGHEMSAGGMAAVKDYNHYEELVDIMSKKFIKKLKILSTPTPLIQQ